MTIREITDKILEYHPKFDADPMMDATVSNQEIRTTNVQALCLHLYQLWK